MAGCPRCAENHTIIACPYVKAVDFEFGYVDGSPGSPSIRRIEFLTPADCGPPPREAAAAAPAPDYPKKGR